MYTKRWVKMTSGEENLVLWKCRVCQIVYFLGDPHKKCPLHRRCISKSRLFWRPSKCNECTEMKAWEDSIESINKRDLPSQLITDILLNWRKLNNIIQYNVRKPCSLSTANKYHTPFPLPALQPATASSHMSPLSMFLSRMPIPNISAVECSSLSKTPSNLSSSTETMSPPVITFDNSLEIKFPLTLNSPAFIESPSAWSSHDTYSSKGSSPNSSSYFSTSSSSFTLSSSSHISNMSKASFRVSPSHNSHQSASSSPPLPSNNIDYMIKSEAPVHISLSVNSPISQFSSHLPVPAISNCSPVPIASLTNLPLQSSIPLSSVSTDSLPVLPPNGNCLPPNVSSYFPSIKEEPLTASSSETPIILPTITTISSIKALSSVPLTCNSQLSQSFLISADKPDTLLGVSKQCNIYDSKISTLFPTFDKNSRTSSSNVTLQIASPQLLFNKPFKPTTETNFYSSPVLLPSHSTIKLAHVAPITCLSRELSPSQSFPSSPSSRASSPIAKRFKPEELQEFESNRPIPTLVKDVVSEFSQLQNELTILKEKQEKMSASSHSNT